jgi:hypothetical protein
MLDYFLEDNYNSSWWTSSTVIFLISFSISSIVASGGFLINHIGPNVFVSIAPSGAVIIIENTAVVKMASPKGIYSVIYSLRDISSIIPPIAA